MLLCYISSNASSMLRREYLITPYTANAGSGVHAVLLHLCHAGMCTLHTIMDALVEWEHYTGGIY